MSSTRPVVGGHCVALAAVAFLAAASHAVAQPLSLRDRLFGAPSDERAFAIPNVARFQSDNGEAFVLDRSAGAQVFMKFETNPEIWALEPTPGPRGDVIYKDDMGEPVLRFTRIGGLTLFTEDNPGGVAAAFAGQAALLRPPPVFSPGALLLAFAQASQRAGRAINHSISFEAAAENVPLNAISLIADAAGVTAEAFVEVAGQGERARHAMARYSKVRIGIAKKPEVQASGNSLKIGIDPERGLAGRPSSHRIAAVLAKR